MIAKALFALAVALALGASFAPTLDGLQNGIQEILSSKTEDRNRPNIVFVLTDDQDQRMESLDYMPLVQKHLLAKGTQFSRHYCTVALCCPSRVSLWTGRAAHNTNVTDVNPPFGGYPKFVSQGFNSAWLPLWLQDSGYNTYYTGKLFNTHDVNNYDSPFPSGFNGSDFLLDPHTYDYLNATFQRNQDTPVSYEGQYSTDVLASKAYGFLEDGLAHKERPFFLVAAPIGPHSNMNFDVSASEHSIVVSPPVSAKRHEHLFADAVVPRSPNFNPDEPQGVSWISRLPKQNQANVDSNDHFYRQRLRALQSVDELVEGILQRLETAGVLDNTYIFFSSDNGYHIGQHRLQPGKECGFEEDTNVPLIVRGPGVATGRVSDVVTSHTDLAPTFLSLGGGKQRDDFDGAPIPLTLEQQQTSEPRSEHVNIEYWGYALNEGKFGEGLHWNNTYKALRLIGDGYNFYYNVWCSGEHELYDVLNDPYETKNLFQSNHSQELILRASDRMDLKRSTTIVRLLPRLDSLVMVLKTCKGRSCTHPWQILHPVGDVENLYDALDARFDDFYEVQQERVRFDRCEKGFILESEGPLNAKAFSDGDFVVTARGGSRWAELV